MNETDIDLFCTTWICKGLHEPKPRFKALLTPQMVSNLRIAIARENVVPTHLVVAGDVWIRMMVDIDFVRFMDAESKHAKVEQGYLAQLLGLQVISDTFSPPQDRFLVEGYLGVASIQDGATIDSVYCLV